jgi:trigger factor
MLVLSLTLGVTSCSKKRSDTETEEIDTSYDPAEYVELCDYKNIEISDDEVTVSDSDLMDYIRTEMDGYSTTKEITDRGAMDGDIVSINIQGYLNGKVLDTLTAYYFELKVGEGTLGDEFDEELMGMETGETKSFDIAYDEDYPSENLAGNTVRYEVKVNYILEYTEYEITDENVNYLSGGEYETVEQMKEAAEKHLLETDFDTYRDKCILRKVIEGCTIKDYPEAQLVKYESDMVSSYRADAINAGYDDLDAYLADEYGMTMDHFSGYVDEYCKSALGEEMIYKLIADIENITLTDEEYDSYVDYFANAYTDTYYYSMTSEEFAESLGEENIRDALLIKKTQDMICRWNAE